MINRLQGSVENLRASVEALNTRLDGFEAALIETDDKLDVAITAASQAEITANDTADNATPRDQFDHYIGVNYEKFQYLGGLIAEITRMEVKDVLIPTRFGEKVAKIEAENNDFKRDIVHLLKCIADSMSEIQGQITDPLNTTTAMDRLRQEVIERSRTIN